MNNKRAGFYWVDNTPYVSVTTVLDIIAKPQLTYWFGQQVYLAVAKNPQLNEREALAAPYKTSEKAKERGKTIHSIVETWKISQKEIQSLPQQYRKYAQAFYSFVNSTDIVPIAHEKTVYSKKYQYAGTLDLLGKQGDKTVLIDVKTSKDGNIYDEVGLQVSAYKQALREEGIEVDICYALALAKNGEPTLKELKEDHLEPFIACRDLWIWKNKDKCEKLGYKV
jgi:predicted RecB family nuclease